MDLIASRRYQPDAEEPAEIDYIMMPVSELPVSAGLGAFLEGEMFQQILATLIQASLCSRFPRALLRLAGSAGMQSSPFRTRQLFLPDVI